MILVTLILFECYPGWFKKAGQVKYISDIPSKYSLLPSNAIF
jgi:hypothetical protein